MAYKIKKKNTQSHIIVEARAGTGKTSTMIAGLNLMFGKKPKFKGTAEQQAIWDEMAAGGKPDEIIFVAFNKSIQLELEQKVPSGVTAKTLHGLGYSILAKNGYRIQAGSETTRYMVRDMLGYEKGTSMSKEDYKDSMVVEKIVGILKNNLIGWSDEELELVINENDVDVNGNKAQVFNLVKQVMEKSSKLVKGKVNWISFDDMIWLPNVMELNYDKFDLMIVDECFPAGTKVTTSLGEVPIEYISEHPEIDWQVLSSVDGGKTLTYSSVTSAYKTPIKTHLVKVKHEKGEIICTANHPFWVEGKGWIAAGLLTEGDSLPNLQKTSQERLPELFSEMCRSVAETEYQPRNGVTSSAKNLKANEASSERDTKSYGEGGCSEKGFGNTEVNWSQTSHARWEREGSNRATNDSLSSVGQSPSSLAMEPRVCNKQWKKNERISNKLQSGHCITEKNDCCGSGRTFALNADEKVAGQEKGRTTEIVRVVSVEIYQPTSDEQCSGVCEESGFVYTLSVETGSYFAGGLLVKNCQDLNCAQQQMVLKMAHRLILIGDSFQSIYGFRGADVKSMERMEEYLSETKVGVKKLSLTTTWRCPKSHVANVNKYVADIKAADNAAEGVIEHSEVDDLTAQAKIGDMVISRVNANLCAAAFRLIRNGTPCRILGRDYGANLISLVKKLDTDDKIKTLVETLKTWREEEEARINKAYTFPDKQLQLLAEKYQSLVYLTGGLDTVTKLVDRIDSLFSSKLTADKSVTLSTVHKAKGLESDNVFILGREKMPHPMAKKPWEKQQELNLIYVAETRSKHRLILVSEAKEMEPEFN